jgi:type IV pilus assembly protein PilB
MRSVCPVCKQSCQPSEDELKCLFGESYNDKNIELSRTAGCNNCHHTGYYGRTGVFEILPISPTIRRMVTDGSSDDVIKQQGIKEGMKTLRRSAVEAVISGTTTFDEMMRVVDVRVE